MNTSEKCYSSLIQVYWPNSPGYRTLMITLGKSKILNRQIQIKENSSTFL